ncbi:MFS transporter OPA family solute carrier family 37 (glycerol-3-phosphate transporter) member 3 [Clonorchis sinensis]|uniref:Sugar phosphate exchanger 3 n=1 Tax=Clonorchis sinensis TaxID=79923 RepID=H2KPC2_CLOSI|nr:MFS transporter OPA family solute carrier family 37 (glycerol-3-phosphate transporter) member 3 [Clonorchis sinensis]
MLISPIRSTVDSTIVFILTYLAYALLHANRKAFGNLKPAITQVWTVPSRNGSAHLLNSSETWSRSPLFDSQENAAMFLGILDSLFMASYAIGLYVSGWLGDRFNHRLVLCFGLSGSALIIFLFGVVTEWTGFYNRTLYAILWILNGFTQSTVWPSSVAIMNLWFGRFRGLVLGIWTSCASVGNVIGDLVVGLVVSFGYHYAFLVLSVCLLGIAVVVFCGLLESPNRYVRIHSLLLSAKPDDARLLLSQESEDDQAHEPSKPLPFLNILLVPDVISCSLAYACIKLVNYAMFFWLTFYLTENFHWSNSDASTFSVWYDVGGILGGIAAGLISDIANRHISRHAVSFLFSVAAIPALLAYRFTPGDPKDVNGLVMTLAGFFVGGPAVLISAVIAGDIGEYPELRSSRTQATVAGIIDGTGSIGAAIGQLLIPYLGFHFNWSFVFYLFTSCMAVTSFCLIPSWIRHRRRILRTPVPVVHCE